jgi:hypothetical protein
MTDRGSGAGLLVGSVVVVCEVAIEVPRKD